jgi:hypothetical protein
MRKNLLFAGLVLNAGAHRLLAATDVAEWEKLKHITYKTDYTVVQRNLECITGEIVSIDPDLLCLKTRSPKFPYAPSDVRILRADIARVTDGGTSAHNMVFSSRSSWMDVKDAVPRGPLEHLLILMTDRRRYTSKLIAVEGNSLTLDSTGKHFPLSKSDIQPIYYVRVKPISASEEYIDQEAPYLNPRIWFGPLFVRTLAVLLYDGSMLEDDTPLTCSAPP